MKNLTVSILSVFLITTHIYAQKTTQTNIDVSNIEQFYYQKGYNDAKKEAYAKGYRDAIRDVLKRLAKYKQKMEAIEASKYLLANGKITYPQVFKVRKPDGTFEIVITKPTVEDMLTINDLVLIPTLNNSDLSSVSTGSFNNDNVSSTNPKYSDSFHLENEKYIVNTPFKRVKALNYQTCLTFPKIPSVKQILINSGKPFVEEKDDYKIYFNSEKEKQSFCQNIGGKICNLAK